MALSVAKAPECGINKYFRVLTVKRGPYDCRVGPMPQRKCWSCPLCRRKKDQCFMWRPDEGLSRVYQRRSFPPSTPSICFILAINALQSRPHTMTFSMFSSNGHDKKRIFPMTILLLMLGGPHHARKKNGTLHISSCVRHTCTSATFDQRKNQIPPNWTASKPDRQARKNKFPS